MSQKRPRKSDNRGDSAAVAGARCDVWVMSEACGRPTPPDHDNDHELAVTSVRGTATGRGTVDAWDETA